MDELIKFGYNLKFYRNKAKLSQEQLGELSNLHRTYIGLLESGKRNPSLKTIIKISNALNCSCSDLLGGINSYE